MKKPVISPYYQIKETFEQMIRSVDKQVEKDLDKFWTAVFILANIALLWIVVDEIRALIN